MSDVHDFGAVGDGRNDDTEALQHAINDGDGGLVFPPGDYVISQPLKVDLQHCGPFSLHGQGGAAKLIMIGIGPAISLLGTHEKTADPSGFRPSQWRRERMPTIEGLAIEGRNSEADGVRIEGVMQPILRGVQIRQTRNAVHLAKRSRNIVIEGCQIYHNTGVGVYFDQANLHQAIISHSHISYCRRGGVRIEASEVRNLQITGNDIEYNNARSHPDFEDEPTAEIYIDSGETGSIREGTISGNTIQATASPHGANIRLIGAKQENRRVGMWTICGNLIGSQTTNVHLTSTRGVVLSGNCFYNGQSLNVLAERSQNLVLSGNCFGHNPDYKPNHQSVGVRLEDCQDCNLHGLTLEDLHGEPLPEGPPRSALLELVRCRRMNLTGLQLLDGFPYGAHLHDCEQVLLSNGIISDRRQPRRMKAAVKWTGKGMGNRIVGGIWEAGLEKTLEVEETAGVKVDG